MRAASRCRRSPDSWTRVLRNARRAACRPATSSGTRSCPRRPVSIRKPGSVGGHDGQVRRTRRRGRRRRSCRAPKAMRSPAGDHTGASAFWLGSSNTTRRFVPSGFITRMRVAKMAGKRGVRHQRSGRRASTTERRRSGRRKLRSRLNAGVTGGHVPSMRPMEHHALAVRRPVDVGDRRPRRSARPSVKLMPCDT